uniref:Roundabout homolog 3 n=1 Tax=Nothobranchius kuhntae TaxID=321403 RepID=A0A1A8I498_NOTKU
MEKGLTLGPVLLFFVLRTLAYGSRPRIEDAAPRIVEHPSDLIVSKGEPATLNCKAEGRPTPTVEWYKDGERVETDREDPRSHRMLLPSGSLFFLRIVHGRRSKPDEGIYVCVARNYMGEAVSRNASLEVAILRDDFRQTPSDVVVAAGEPAVMECVPPRGHPEPTISWKKNNIRVNDRDERITIRGGKLMISTTRKSDAGTYVCVGTNMVGEKDSDPAELVVFERPVFTKQPVNQVVLIEDMVEFFCEAYGDPTPTVHWKREEGEFPPGRSEIRSDNSLRLSQVKTEDEGTYTCVSENSVGKAEASATLQVHVPPQILVRPRDQITAPGGTVTFLCSTKGNPPPAVFWQKEGSQVLLFPIQEPLKSSRSSVSLSGELTISDVQVEDSGFYICQAISVAGSILTKARLEVESEVPLDRVPPIIRQGPANHTLASGATAHFHCHIIGTPTPSIQWEKDGQRVLGKTGRTSFLENGTLQITSLQETDSGVYTCLASSSSGETSWSGVLTVKDSIDPSVAQATEPFQLPGPPHKPIVTDVSKNSVSLTWQPNAHEGGAAVTSYVIEAFSQSAGSTWQTVAEKVKMETYTITGLLPNTVYLFIVRAVNTYGLSDPSPISEPVRTQDVSPPGQGVDHRQVQRELRDVVVQLQDPVVLTSAFIQVSWTVDRQSPYVQGYRLFYRPSGGTWLLQDINSPSERSSILTSLRRGTEYELKIRPYFDEFQGRDSHTLLVRIPEEVICDPPKRVTVTTLKQSNNSSINVSWEAPPTQMQNGTITEYRVWCFSSGSDNHMHYYINRTVGSTTLSTVLTGLMPNILYQVEVAAVTIAGVGTRSPPVSVLIEVPSEQPPSPGDEGTSDHTEESSVSLAEQITDVVKQPAFIAGIGGACWVILMSFSVWIYCRHKKRKEISHYTTSFAYTPAVGFSHADGSGLCGRPSVPGGSVGTYPWLADSWPSASLVHSGKDITSGCSSNLETAERYYDEAGLSDYLGQTERCSTGGSAEGPIYSTIDGTSEDLQSFTSIAPYATTSTRPFTTQADELQDKLWTTHPGPCGAHYAQPDRCSGKPRQKALGKAVKTPSLNWMEALSPPLVVKMGPCEQDFQLPEHDSDPGSDEEWCPPLPERTYLMDGCEDNASSPQRNNTLSTTTTYSHQSTTVIPPLPHEEPRAPQNLPDFSQVQGQQLSRRRLPCGPVSVPQVLSTLTQSTSNLSGNQDHDVNTLQGKSPAHCSVHNPEPGPTEDRGPAATLAYSWSSPAEPGTPPNQKSRTKKKLSRHPVYRRDHQGDLPPPPEPPPVEDRLRGPQACTEPRSASSSLDCSEFSSPSHQRKGSGQIHPDDEDMMVFGAKASWRS